MMGEIISPIIIALCLIGSYIMREYWQDMMITTFFGIMGYYMRKYGYHPIPLVLGLILGPIAEVGFFPVEVYGTCLPGRTLSTRRAARS